MKEVIVPADDLVCLGKEKLQEVIRCKDCDLYGIVELKQDGTVDMRYKPSWCFLWRSAMNANGYCSYAVRREK